MSQQGKLATQMAEMATILHIYELSDGNWLSSASIINAIKIMTEATSSPHAHVLKSCLGGYKLSQFRKSTKLQLKACKSFIRSSSSSDGHLSSFRDVPVLARREHTAAEPWTR